MVDEWMIGYVAAFFV